MPTQHPSPRCDVAVGPALERREAADVYSAAGTSAKTTVVMRRSAIDERRTSAELRQIAGAAAARASGPWCAAARTSGGLAYRGGRMMSRCGDCATFSPSWASATITDALGSLGGRAINVQTANAMKYALPARVIP